MRSDDELWMSEEDEEPRPLPPAARVSGRVVVLAMFLFGITATAGLWGYWTLHTGPFRPLQDALAKDLDSLAFNDPAIPVAANVDARFVTQAADSRDCLVRQVTGSVRWVECIQLLAAQGATYFIEVGPGKVLSGLNRQILGKDSAIPTLNVEDTASLEKTLASFN